MKIAESAVRIAALVFAVTVLAEEENAAAEPKIDRLINSVVKLEVETAKSDILCPWISKSGAGTGSGVVIGEGRILTCAHCVADATYIRIRKQNEDTLYHASVMFIDNEADLALVGVADPKFMADVKPMSIGKTPDVQDDVIAVGYPTGGNDISYTRGIVSRIEDIMYSHSLSRLLGIQIDAAINPGNSGGPVLDMRNLTIAGIAFQGQANSKTESLGYIIPPDIIRHFLKDIEDGRVDGYSCMPFEFGTMESPVKRSCYRMGEEQTGVVVDHVYPVAGDTSVRTDDVILEIDGYAVSNNGRIRIDGGKARSVNYPLYTRQIGERIPIKVLRDGKVVDTFITAAKRNRRIRGWMYDSRPDYLVYGGFVFTTVSYDYLVRTKADFHDDISDDKEFADDEPVVISFYHADESIEGYIGCVEALVRSVNGIKVRNLRHLAELLDRCDEGFVRIHIDKDTEWDLKLIVDAREMRESTGRVMKRNLIPFDRSEDLRRK